MDYNGIFGRVRRGWILEVHSMVGVHWITWDYIPKEGAMSELTYSWRFTRMANRLRARTLSGNGEEDWIS